MPKPQELLSAAQEISSELVALRRLLHENPEFALNLPVTQKILLERLEGLGISNRFGPSKRRWTVSKG